ncbi:MULTISPECIES: SpoIIE family protein phosphatase [unclassified Thioalkalivibrio]|uniref:SpoIIE family protein phosphatase n=1 Tax=unclassified Thioalkalivibrio TaxID=2621013 RepID=UPI0003625FB2|nr:MULTISPECIES: SpoIIE family protein phosphatase [unclassified Thioalkalivibrio]
MTYASDAFSRQEAAEDPLSGEGRVLVVDDDKHNRRLLHMMLEGCGYTTVEAENGLEAIAICRDDPPDLILMDVMMPEMDGLEATRRIKADCDGRFVPVIFLTALDDEHTLLRAIAAGGDDFLAKPLNLSVLKAKIHAMERLRDLQADLRSRNDQLLRASARQAWEEETAESLFSRAITRRNRGHERLGVGHLSAATFSGDVVLSDYTPEGSLRVLLGDFTGHGLSAAIGAYPVSETFHTLTREGAADAELIHQLNHTLHTFLPPTMFMGAVLIGFSPDGRQARIWNGGMPDVRICSAREVRHVASQAMPLGILPRLERGLLPEEHAVGPDDTIIASSDGVIEAVNAAGEALGDEALDRACCGQRADSIYDTVWGVVQRHAEGTTPDDDMTLVCIPCTSEVLLDSPVTTGAENTGNLRWSLELGGPQLARADLTQEARNQLRHWFPDLGEHAEALHTVIAELCNNAFEHGVLGLDSSMKTTVEGFEAYYRARSEGLACPRGRIGISLHYRRRGAAHCMRIRVRDSGAGFDHEAVRAAIEGAGAERLWGRGLNLVHRLCTRVRHVGRGNLVEAEYCW